MESIIDRAALTAVRKALAALLDVEAHLDAAEKTGFNVAEERARHSHYKELAKSIINTYEPILARTKPITESQ